MNIPDEIIKKGSVIIYNDSDTSIIKEIDEYKKHMLDCRIKMKLVVETKFAFTILNPLIIFGIIASESASVFSNSALAIILLIIYTTIFIIFSFVRNSLMVITVVTDLLSILDLRFIILLIADIVLLVVHERTDKPLRNELSYPTFSDIKVRFQSPDSKYYNKFD
ncbi:MAG: hypothetical protein GX286_00970 [Clostridiales bacterium]|jgi:hypothetical protein|nr:hypothetical protein [Clostridiales bacterium]